MADRNLIFLLLVQFSIIGISSGLQCYKFSCWGDECNSFVSREDELVDQCPNDARGCLHSFGKVRLDKATAGSRTLLTTRDGKPQKRETRSCWVPNQGLEGRRGELDHCLVTSMFHFFPPLGKMLSVDSIECICSGHLCNGKEVPNNGCISGPKNYFVVLLVSLMVSTSFVIF